MAFCSGLVSYSHLSWPSRAHTDSHSHPLSLLIRRKCATFTRPCHFSLLLGASANYEGKFVQHLHCPCHAPFSPGESVGKWTQFSWMHFIYDKVSLPPAVCHKIWWCNQGVFEGSVKLRAIDVANCLFGRGERLIYKHF